MTNLQDETKKGGNERAQESAAPRPMCQDCFAVDILRNELKKVSEMLQSVRLECEQLRATSAEQQEELRMAIQHLSESQKRQEKFFERAKSFFGHLFNLRSLAKCWSESSNRKKAPADAHSGLTFPQEKLEIFNRCWSELHADVPNVLKLDSFFDSLRACSTENTFVREICQLADMFPQVRTNRFLRSQEGITQLTMLVDHPDDSLKDIPNIVRRVRYSFDK
jgi:hypothetical protein